MVWWYWAFKQLHTLQGMLDITKPIKLKKFKTFKKGSLAELLNFNTLLKGGNVNTRASVLASAGPHSVVCRKFRGGAWHNDRNRWCYKVRPVRLTPRPFQQRLQSTVPLNPINQTITTLIDTSSLVRHLTDQRELWMQYLQRGEAWSPVLVDIQNWKICSSNKRFYFSRPGIITMDDNWWCSSFAVKLRKPCPTIPVSGESP